ncbi:hypothetical protein RG47T_3875 [Mucilaginibacter polytrichastri]|uniref:Uncharacterized protein n=1 Tax=Mucilaginibacter polytrichastri TaxID=1302689 RepID=A0A1Q6A332_9SPHI|nr:hypothetical protein RG47T_3875 [Mucilaginibacter polytrichastri]
MKVKRNFLTKNLCLSYFKTLFFKVFNTVLTGAVLQLLDIVHNILTFAAKPKPNVELK